MLVTDPRQPPAARAPEPGGDLVVEHVDDPRFALLTAREPSEHGLRIDPATGRSVNYTFPSARPALGRAVSGGSLLVLVNGPAGAELVYRDRGSGKVHSRLPLPGAAGCSTPATYCAPVVAIGQIWAALAGG